MNCMRRNRELGLTMIEVMVSSVILFAIVAMSSWLVWSSSKQVSTDESRLQLDMDARAFISTISRELQQTRPGQVLAIDPVSIPRLDPPLGTAAMNATSTPGTGSVALAGTAFHGIRFKIPGKSMDLTQSNAAGFDIATYAADKNSGSPTNPDWTTEIQYWWEPDSSVLPLEGTGVGGGGAWAEGNAIDGVDNNNNGVVDEGVIKRIETTFDTAGALQKRVVTTVCHNVQCSGPTVAGLPAYWSGKTKVGLTFMLLPAVPDAYGVPQSTNRIQVTATFERQDPENKARTIIRQVSSTIDMRNF